MERHQMMDRLLLFSKRDVRKVPEPELSQLLDELRVAGLEGALQPDESKKLSAAVGKLLKTMESKLKELEKLGKKKIDIQKFQNDQETAEAELLVAHRELVLQVNQMIQETKTK